MAITYLSGGRIQGSSTGSASPTVAKTIFQGAGLESKWVDNSEDISYNATTDVIDFVVSGSGNTDSYATFDLQDSTALNGSSASDTAWVLRFKLDITTYTLNHGSSSALVIGISNQGTSTGPASQNGIGFEVGVGNNDALYRLQTSNSAGWARGSADAVFAETPAVETTYVEVKRTSATNVTVSMYSDSAYSTLLEAETITNVSGTTGLRYLSVKSDTQSEDNLLAGTVSEFELWNAVTSPTQDDKSTITDVPLGTRYEETDTRKIFRRKAGGLAQVRNVFNTSNYTYTTSGQSGAVTVTNGDDPSGSVRINLGTGSTSPTYAIATFPDSFTTEDKTFQIDFDYTRASSTSGDNVSFLLTSRTWSDNAPPSGEKDMHFQVVNGGSSGATPSMRFKMHTATEQDGTDTNNDFTQGLGTTHHYRVTGDGTNWKFEKWTNANGDYTGSPDVDQTGLDFPSDWASTNPISKIQFGWQGYWYIDYTIKNVTAKFGTGTADTWVEKGTA